MNRKMLAMLAGWLLALGAPAPARAELQVIIGSGPLQLNPGGTGTLDVTLASSDGSAITLDNYGFEFLIQPITGTASGLAFATSQLQPYSDPSYLFYQDSIINPPGTLDKDISALGYLASPTDYIGGDTADTAVTITDTTPLLLKLTLTAGQMAAGSYKVTLVGYATSYDPNTAQFDGNTYFTVGAGTPALLGFSSTDGRVNVGLGITAIPEPCSVLLAAMGFATLPLLRYPKRRAKVGQRRPGWAVEVEWQRGPIRGMSDVIHPAIRL